AQTYARAVERERYYNQFHSNNQNNSRPRPRYQNRERASSYYAREPLPIVFRKKEEQDRKEFLERMLHGRPLSTLTEEEKRKIFIRFTAWPKLDPVATKEVADSIDLFKVQDNLMEKFSMGTKWKSICS